jgi:hypothetical protein
MYMTIMKITLSSFKIVELNFFSVLMPSGSTASPTKPVEDLYVPRARRE